MDREVRHLIIPVQKDADGSYSAILSDDSLDRDEEFMSPDLIKKWASGGALPLLADHENAMSSFIGAWTDRKIIEMGGHTALAMKPNFFSADANPKAQNIKKQIDEASKFGVGVGVSVGFIPKEGLIVGDKYMHTDAELLEGSIVPVQSNRHAYISLAKRFGIESVNLKKETDVIGAGEPMNKNDKVEEVPKAFETEIKSRIEDHDARIKALEERHKEPTEEEKRIASEVAAAEAKARKELLEKQEKLETEMKAQGAELEKMRGKVNQPKSAISEEMLKAALGGKDATEKNSPYNATEDYMSKKGVKV